MLPEYSGSGLTHADFGRLARLALHRDVGELCKARVRNIESPYVGSIPPKSPRVMPCYVRCGNNVSGKTSPRWVESPRLLRFQGKEAIAGHDARKRAKTRQEVFACKSDCPTVTAGLPRLEVKP